MTESTPAVQALGPGVAAAPSFVDETECLELLRSKFVNVGHELTTIAGERIKQIRHDNTLATRSKSGTAQFDPVTKADITSNNILLTGLRAAFPGIEIISEEGWVRNISVEDERIATSTATKFRSEKRLAGTEMTGCSTKELVLWIDPLDATKEYTEGGTDLLKYVTVMACLAHRGVPIAGVIHFPFQQTSLYDPPLHASEDLVHQPVRGTRVADGPGKLQVTFSRSHDTGVVQQLNRMGIFATGTKAAGAGWKAAEVYKGQFDAYALNSKIKKWDICAGAALLRSTGGGMVKWTGRPINFGARSSKVLAHGMIATATSGSLRALVKQLKYFETFETLYQNAVVYVIIAVGCCVLKMIRGSRATSEGKVKVDAFARQKISMSSWPTRLTSFIMHGTPGSSLLPRIEQVKGNTISPFTPINAESAMSFLFCFVGLQMCYLLWGVCQERLLTVPFVMVDSADEAHFFKFSQYLVFSNRVVAFCISLTLFCCSKSRASSGTSPWPPFYLFSFSSISNTLSSWCQYEALKFLSFPGQVLFKSTKLIPVMLMGYCVNKKTYSLFEYGISLSISSGVAIFMYGKNHHVDPLGVREDETDAFGILLMSLYIVLDAFTSQWQGKLFTRYTVGKLQIMIGINFWSACLTFCTLVFTSEFVEATAFLMTHPGAVLPLFFLSIAGALGQLLIYHTISTFGPLAFVTIMTTRQVLAFLLSTVLFGHSMSRLSGLGAIVVFISLGCRIYTRKK